MALQFNKKYFFLFILLLFIEICITFTKGFVRHTVGDYLVVILIYTLLKSFVAIPPVKAALGVLVFAIVVELLQWIDILALLGIPETPVTRIVLGNTFSFADIIAYTLGILTVLFIENKYNAR